MRSEWNVTKVVGRLERGTLSTSADAAQCAPALRRVCAVVAGWAETHAGDRAWSSLLNASAICKEVEDSVLPLARALEVMRAPTAAATLPPWHVLDLCSGKGFFAALLAGMCDRDPALNVQTITMVDSNDAIKWSHVPLLNASHGAAVAQLVALRASVYDDAFEALLATLQRAVAAKTARVLVVGTHLCRRLSARAVEVYNVLAGAAARDAPSRSVALLLAPCCIPRFGSACRSRWTRFAPCATPWWTAPRARAFGRRGCCSATCSPIRGCAGSCRPRRLVTWTRPPPPSFRRMRAARLRGARAWRRSRLQQRPRHRRPERA